MKNEQIADQFELASKILRENLEWEFKTKDDLWSYSGGGNLGFLIGKGYEIRIKPSSFPPPPEGRKWHNPENFTPENVGKKYRLLLPNEVDGRFIGVAQSLLSRNGKWLSEGITGSFLNTTYRVPLSTPLPDGSVLQVDGTYKKPWVPKFKVGDCIRHKGNHGPVFKVSSIESDMYGLGDTHLLFIGEGGYELATPKLIPLGPEDVPIGSVIRNVNGLTKQCGGWATIISVRPDGLNLNSNSNKTKLYSWKYLFESSEIKRPGEDWKACSKLSQ